MTKTIKLKESLDGWYYTVPNDGEKEHFGGATVRQALTSAHNRCMCGADDNVLIVGSKIASLFTVKELIDL